MELVFGLIILFISVVISLEGRSNMDITQSKIVFVSSLIVLGGLFTVYGIARLFI